jgi:hypothetical protein
MRALLKYKGRFKTPDRFLKHIHYLQPGIDLIYFLCYFSYVVIET